MATTMGAVIDLGDGVERPLVTTTMWAVAAGSRLTVNLFSGIYKWDHDTETGSNTNLGFAVVMSKYNEEIKVEDGNIVNVVSYKGKVINGGAVLCRSIVITANAAAYLGTTVQNKPMGYLTFDQILVVPGNEFTTIEVKIVQKTPLTDLNVKERSYTNQKDMMKYSFFYTGRIIEEDAVWRSVGNSTVPEFDLTTNTLESVIEAIKLNPEKLLNAYTLLQLPANYKLEVAKLPTPDNRDLDLKSTIYVKAGSGGSGYTLRVITNKQWWLLVSVPIEMTNNHAMRTVFMHKAKLV